MPQKKYDFRNQFEKSSRRYSNEEERLTQLQTVIDAHHKQAQTDENKLLERLLKNGDKQRAAEISRAKKNISKAEKRLKELDSVFAKLYEDRACDKVTERNYMMLSGKYQDEQLKLESEIFTLKDKLRETVQSKDNAEKWLSLI